MAPEICIGDVLLACVCEKCQGTGWAETGWKDTSGIEHFVEEIPCTECFRGTGYVLTEAGYAMSAFFELVLGK